MGRPKGSKNKPKTSALEDLLEEPRETKYHKHNAYTDDVWFIYETPHRGKKTLVTTTEYGEKAAKQFIKSIADNRPKSVFEVVKRTGYKSLRDG